MSLTRQPLPQSARDYATKRRREIDAATRAALRQWRRMGEDFDSSYRVIEPTLLQIADAAQGRVADLGAAFIPAVLDETGQTRAIESRLPVNVLSLVGTAGDGRTTEGLLYGAVTHAKQRVEAGAGAGEALQSSSRWLSTSMGTLLSDTGRASEKLSIMARPVTGYVRMLSLPSCGRCAILAGKFYRVNRGFQRHPRCDCVHIPSTEALAGDLTVNTRAYFNSLDEAGQARLVGSRANAAAVRDHDADIGQIVNAYRRSGGVSTAQVYGRDVRYTTEGTTRRGAAYRSMSQAGYAQRSADVRATGARYASTRAPRLMPESIAQIATDRADQERLLRLYGWVL